MLKAMFRLLSALAFAASANGALAQSSPLPPVPAPSADRSAIRAYRLTVPTMERIARAAAALKSADPSLRAEDTAAAAGNTVAELMSNLTRASRLRAFFHRQGLTDHDVVLFPLVIMSAMIALNDPTLAYIQPVSADQIDFYKRHRLALDAIFLDDSPPAKPGKR